MFDIGWSEILVVLVVALVVVGPKDLPRLMRTLGRWVRKARGMADQFRASFDEMARETELDELRSEIEALRHARPLGTLEDEVNRAILPPDSAPVAKPEPAPESRAAPDAEKSSSEPATEPAPTPKSEPPAA